MVQPQRLQPLPPAQSGRKQSKDRPLLLLPRILIRRITAAISPVAALVLIDRSRLQSALPLLRLGRGLFLHRRLLNLTRCPKIRAREPVLFHRLLTTSKLHHAVDVCFLILFGVD